MTGVADFEQDDKGALRFSGSLTLAQLDDLPGRLAALDRPPERIDLSGIEAIDTVGAWLVHRLARSNDIPIAGASDVAKRLIEQVGQVDKPLQVRPDATFPFFRVLGQIGDAVVKAGQTLYGLLDFFGAVMITVWRTIREPRRFRLNAVVRQFEVVGVEALGIIGLMSFLIGIGRLTLRELGVLMTAIMVAGRSGSAFAAQIGSMRLAEEVDAMRTIGVSPMEALVLPRVIAAVFLMPLLGFYSSLVSIIGGGLFCWLSLDIPPITYIQRIREVVPITDMWVGLLKAPVFGLIIAMAGCFQGMQVKDNAEEVGLRTTAAVVQAIFLTIVLDAFFAVFFSQIGWI
jgi:phospholipid/cholesterol/gamma-HCH transport system permease protein